MGCVSAGAMAAMSLFGCSSQQSAPASNETASSGTAASSAEANSETAASSAKAAPAASAGDPAVVFFSCTGNTEAVAEKIAAAADGTLMRIEAAEPYSSADIDYNSDCRANAEQDSGSARPTIAAPVPDVAPFDTVYVGYPIWWGKVPRIMLTFMEGIDLSGKTVVPFCTSGSSPIDGSIAEVAQAASGADVLEGRRFSADVPQQEVDSWVSDL